MKKFNLTILSFMFLFILTISFASATMYVADNRSLYRSFDNTNFELVLPYGTPNLSLATSLNITRDVRALHTDSSGQYVLLIDGNNTDATVDNGRRLLISKDYGSTYIAYPVSATPQLARYLDTDMSKSGQYQYAISGTTLFRSVDYGLNFNNVSVASTSLHKVSTSDDGKLVSIVESVGGAGVFISNDYGATFTKYNVLGAGYYITTCIQDNIVYAIGQSGINSYKNLANGTGVWTTISAQTLSSATNVESLCYGSKLLYLTRYSSNNGTSFNTSNGGTYFSEINNMSQFYSTNGTNIIQSTNGLSYSMLVSGFKALGRIAVSDQVYVPVPNIQTCIDDTTYCSDAFYNYNTNQYECYYANIEYCADGCTTSNNVSVCSNIQANECNIIGESKCYDSTIRLICEDNNGDGYLDYTTTETCAPNTYCTEQYKASFCSNVSASGDHASFGIVVTPYSVSDANTSYIVDSALRSVAVQTVYAIHNQKFYTIGTNFLSRTCDYNESTQLTQVSTTIVNDTQYNLNSALISNSIVRFSILPNISETVIVNINSQLGTPLSSLKYVRNSSAKNICIKTLGDVSLYCDYDYSTSDTLTSVDAEYTFDFTSKTYTLSLLFNRDLDNVRKIYPISFSATDLFSVNINATGTQLFSLSVVTIPQFTSFSVLANNSLTLQSCLYTTNGLHKVRTYGNNNGQPDYSSYTDYTVEMKNFGLTQQELADATTKEDFFGGSGISEPTKYLIVLIVLVVIFGGFTVVGFTSHTEKISIIMGTIVSVFALVLFTLIGWIPAWIVVMLVILALALIILLPSFKESPSG